MSKYSPEELKAMATEALEAEARGDERWLRLIMTLCMLTGMEPISVQILIREMADG